MFGYPSARGVEALDTAEERNAAWVAQLQDEADQYLVVDGEVWKKSGEPRWEVSYGRLGVTLDVGTFDSTTVEPGDYFRADEYEQAMEHVRTLAAERGEDVTEPYVKITVHDSSVLRLVVPARESRETVAARRNLAELVTRFAETVSLAAGSPLRYGTPNTKAGVDALWAEVVAAQAALASLTDDLAGLDARERPFEDR